MKKFSLERNAQCLCGSGKKYKNCCENILSNITKKIDVQKEINEKNFDKALKISLADLTRYMIHVKRDTEPMLLNNPILGEDMLNLDMMALQELLDKTLFVIKTGNLDIDFIAMLNNLRGTFNNLYWHQLLTYYKAVWYYLYQNNLKEAAVILSEVSYKEIHNVGFLQLYLDVKNKDLSFSEKMEIIDLLITRSNSPTEKMQYMATKGVEFIHIDDIEKSKELFNEAVIFAEKNIHHFNKTYDYFHLGNLYNQVGKMFDNKGYLENAVTYYTKIFEDKNVTQKGISNAYARLGDAYLNLDNPEKALECYEKSVEIDENILSKIFIARMFTINEEFEKASEILNSINISELEDEGKLDFAFVYAELMLHAKKKDGIEFILIKLKELEISSKYFNDKKNKFIIDLQDLLHTSNDNDESSGIRGFLEKLNNSLILQPNIAGIGINFNEILKSILKRKSK
ncbi:tetratricopeptide repeat protein [Bacillus wiedmannii]|uniref:tetratricopeptide repeat protein n=1 Tax=Bacillus wiedmannii TaxID=1890302 RepID=UPI003D970BEB